MSENFEIRQRNEVDNTESNSLYRDVCSIIDQAQMVAYCIVNEVLIKRNWLLGLRINVEMLQARRAEYGKQIVVTLADNLTRHYGEGFTWRNLYNYIDFYRTHNDFFVLDDDTSVIPEGILHALRAKSSKNSLFEILHVMRAKSPIRLSWTHYHIILQEDNKEAQERYEHWRIQTVQGAYEGEPERQYDHPRAGFEHVGGSCHHRDIA